MTLHKYPRTQHLHGSQLQKGDHDMDAVSWDELSGKHLVIEEKIDGANSGISFDEKGNLQLQSRGHYLRGGPREKQFDVLKQWASCHRYRLCDVLGSRYVMYGEWMAAKHTVFYDALPHYFMEFDVLDTQTSTFLDTPSRRALLAPLPVCSVRVIDEGVIASLGHLADMVGTSAFITADRISHLHEAAEAAGVGRKDAEAHTDMHTDMEGLYVKWEEQGVVKGRYKFVRASFTNAILEQEEHWHDRPIIHNALVKGAYEKMFAQ